MSTTALTHMLFVLVPLGLTLVLYALIWRTKGPHPATYKMSEPWKHAPILWAADEPGQEHATGHSYAADSAAGSGNIGDTGTHPVMIGGGASGKW